jgi:radial spoke head protein 9
VPVGSFRKNTVGCVQKNEAFRGLKFGELTSLDSFMHLRPCEQREKIELSAREEDIFCHDFMDNAALQKPAQGWTVQKDEINQAVVVLRSRVWPGFTAYARANAPIYGSLYIGNGIKQLDLPFMI